MIDEKITIQSDHRPDKGKTEISAGNNLARINPMPKRKMPRADIMYKVVLLNRYKDTGAWRQIIAYDHINQTEAFGIATLFLVEKVAWK